MSALKWTVGLVAALVMAGLGYVVGARHAWKAPVSSVVVASVNGQDIYSQEWESALRLTGRPVLDKLVGQRIVLQEAARLGITLSEEEMQPLKKLKDGDSQGPIAQDLRAQILLKKILLRDVSEEKKREVYALFAEELTRYDISCLVLADWKEAKLVQQELDEGGSFEKVSERYKTDSGTKGKAGRLTDLTLTSIATKFGSPVSEVVFDLPIGKVSPPIPSKPGPVFVKVNWTRSSYEELKSSVEDMIAVSKKREVFDALTKRAEIVFPGPTPTPAAPK